MFIFSSVYFEARDLITQQNIAVFFWNSSLRHFIKSTASYFCFWTKNWYCNSFFFFYDDIIISWFSVYLNIIHFFVNSIHLVDSFLQCWPVSEHSCMVLHRLYNTCNQHFYTDSIYSTIITAINFTLIHFFEVKIHRTLFYS